MSTTDPKLFQPMQLGDISLQHRVVFAPCTRLRNSPEGVPLDISVQYYEQRSTVPGTLLIAEGQLLTLLSTVEWQSDDAVIVRRYMYRPESGWFPVRSRSLHR